MGINDANIGDELSFYNDDLKLTETFIVSGKCEDFYWDGDPQGDVFMRKIKHITTMHPNGWVGMSFVPCDKCTLLKSTSVASGSKCTCSIQTIMQSGCKCGSFQKLSP